MSFYFLGPWLCEVLSGGFSLKSQHRQDQELLRKVIAGQEALSYVFFGKGMGRGSNLFNPKFRAQIHPMIQQHT